MSIFMLIKQSIDSSDCIWHQNNHHFVLARSRLWSSTDFSQLRTLSCASFFKLQFHTKWPRTGFQLDHRQLLKTLAIIRRELRVRNLAHQKGCHLSLNAIKLLDNLLVRALKLTWFIGLQTLCTKKDLF